MLGAGFPKIGRTGPENQLTNLPVSVQDAMDGHMGLKKGFMLLEVLGQRVAVQNSRSAARRQSLLGPIQEKGMIEIDSLPEPQTRKDQLPPTPISSKIMVGNRTES